MELRPRDGNTATNFPGLPQWFLNYVRFSRHKPSREGAISFF
jgi:hypothetical protein